MPDYDQLLKRLEDALVQQCQGCISRFSKSEENKQVYAFVIEFDVVNDSSKICWNTLGGLKKTLAKDCYKDYSPSKINAFDGVKYNSGDFSFEDYCFPDSEIGRMYAEFANQLDDKSDEYEARAEQDRRSALIRAIERLRPDFTQFDLTPDFVAYVSDWQRYRSDWPATMRATIPEGLFNKLFPSFKEVGQILGHIRGQGDLEQAEFWVREFEAYNNGRTTAFNEHLENSAQQFGVVAEGALEKLGPSALPITLDAFERSLLDQRDRNILFAPAGQLDYLACSGVRKDVRRRQQRRRIGRAASLSLSANGF